MRRRRAAGFTLVEVMVALVVGGMALAGAAMLLSALGGRAEAIETAAERVDRDANAERLLQNLFANLDLQGDTTRALVGDERSVSFRAWCDTPAGWLDRCSVRLFFEQEQGVWTLRLALPSTRTPPPITKAASSGTVLRSGFHAGGFRYLASAKDGGSWVASWSEIVAPAAVALIVERDTLLLSVWGGG